LQPTVTRSPLPVSSCACTLAPHPLTTATLGEVVARGPASPPNRVVFI